MSGIVGASGVTLNRGVVRGRGVVQTTGVSAIPGVSAGVGRETVYDMLGPALPAPWTYTRASAANVIGVNGRLSSVATNAPRFPGLVTPATLYNRIANNTNPDALYNFPPSVDVPPPVPGINVYKTTVPAAGNLGAMQTTGAEAPVPGATYTAAALIWFPPGYTGGDVWLNPEGNNDVTAGAAKDASGAVQGQWQWVTRVFTLAPTAASLTFGALVFRPRIAQVAGQVFYASAWQIYRGDRSGEANPGIVITSNGGGANVDSTGVSAWRQRTNAVRNPRAEGATVGQVGAGGVLPTNWEVSGPLAGIDVDVVRVTTEYGFPVIDIRFHGTSLAGGFFVLGFDTFVGSYANVRPAASAYVTLVGGSVAGLAPGSECFLEGYMSGVGNTNGRQVFTPVPGDIPANRYVAQAIAAATPSGMQTALRLNVVANGVVDITLRVAAPQNEADVLGGASQPILPPAAAPAATTVAAEALRITGGPPAGFNSTNGLAVAISYAINVVVAPAGAGPVIGGWCGAGGFNDSVYLTHNNIVRGGSVIPAPGGTVTVPGVSPARVQCIAAITDRPNVLGIAYDGLAAQATFSGTPQPVPVTVSAGCSPWGADGQINGVIQEVRLINAFLQSAQMIDQTVPT